MYSGLIVSSLTYTLYLQLKMIIIMTLLESIITGKTSSSLLWSLTSIKQLQLQIQIEKYKEKIQLKIH